MYYTANNTPLVATHSGDFILHLSETTTITLKNTVYIPDTPHTIISIGHLTQIPELQAIFADKTVSIIYTPTNQVLFQGTKDPTTNLYKIPFFNNKPTRFYNALLNEGNINTVFNLEPTVISSNRDIWNLHLSTAHMSLPSLKGLIQKLGLSYTIPPDQETKIKNCEICKLVNHVKVPHNHETFRPAIRVLQRVHIDTAGPFLGKQFFRSSAGLQLISVKYYTTFLIDEFSNYITPIISTNRAVGDEIFNTLQVLNSKFRDPISSVRSDNAKEMPSKAQLATIGIDRDEIPGYSPVLNGRVERANRTMVSIIRKISLSFGPYLFHTYLLFPYLVKYAARIHNNTPRKSTNFSSTPHQLFYNNDYTLPFIHFGQDLLIKLNSQNEAVALGIPVHNKLIPDTVKGTFLGYGSDSYSYVVMFQTLNYPIRLTTNVTVLPSFDNIFSFFSRVNIDDVNNMKVSFDQLEQVYDGTISDADQPPLTFLSPELVDTTTTTNTTESNTSPDPNINPPSENHADDIQIDDDDNLLG